MFLSHVSQPPKILPTLDDRSISRAHVDCSEGRSSGKLANRKQKKCDWKETNFAYFGSELEKQARTKSNIRYRHDPKQLQESLFCPHSLITLSFLLLEGVPYFTAEAPTCFDSYNQPRLGGGRLFEHAALNRGSAHLSQLAPCCSVAV